MDTKTLKRANALAQEIDQLTAGLKIARADLDVLKAINQTQLLPDPEIRFFISYNNAHRRIAFPMTIDEMITAKQREVAVLVGRLGAAQASLARM